MENSVKLNNTMYNLKIISSTVRPGRKGPIVAQWIADLAEKSGNFNVEVLDLGVVNLPLLNEPLHPMMQKYEFEHTRSWAAKIEEADAFIFVTAEYDHGYPAPLKNAIEYLMHEWSYKAAGIVSYAGISAGTRASNDLKRDLATMRMIPLAEQVNIPMFTQFINGENQFVANEVSIQSVHTMLKAIVRWTKGLKIIKADI